MTIYPHPHPVSTEIAPAFWHPHDGRIYRRPPQGGMRRLRALDFALMAEPVRTPVVTVQVED